MTPSNEQTSENHPARLAAGVCLSFDDLFVANWTAAQPVFDAYEAVATFCVSHLHLATGDQLAGLHRLQNAGHEIGYHSRTHPKLKPYLRTQGLTQWIAEELDRGVLEHRAAGFPATSFACPYHASTPKTRAACAERFVVSRCGGPRAVTADNAVRRIYTQAQANATVDNIGSIDLQHPVSGGLDRVTKLLDMIVAQGGVGVFTGHDIRPTASGKGRFYLTQDDLGKVLDAVRSKGLKFYRLTDLATPMSVKTSGSGQR